MLAASLGVTAQAVRSARQRGRISGPDDDGLYDAELASREFVENRKQPPNRGAGRPRAPAVSHPTPQSTAAAGRTNRPPTLIEVQISHERAKLAERRLKIRRARGELIAWEPFRREMFAFVRRERDHWMTLPSRLAPELAAKFSLDLAEVQVWLENALRQELAHLAQRLPIDDAVPHHHGKKRSA